MRYHFAAIMLALSLATCAGPQALAAAPHDDITTQQSHPPRELLEWQLADATVTPPSDAVTITTVTPVQSALNEAVQTLLGLIAAALSALVAWALRWIAAKFNIDAKNSALASVQHLVDEGIDLIRLKATNSVGDLGDRYKQVNDVFEIVWPMAKKFAISMGWTEAELKVYIGTRLAPVTA